MSDPYFPDHPDITRMRVDGYINEPLPDTFCPCCGARNPEVLYINDGDEVFGCEVCVEEVDADDWFANHED